MLVQILHYQCPAWLHALQEVPLWPVPDSPVFQAFELRLVQNLHVRAVSELLPIGLPLFIIYLYFNSITLRPLPLLNKINLNKMSFIFLFSSFNFTTF